MSQPMMAQETFQAAAVRVWAQLQAQLLNVTTIVNNPVRRAVTPDSVLAGWDTYVKGAGPAMVAALSPSGALTMRVIRGEKTPEWWLGYAQQAQKDLGDVLRYVGEGTPTWARFSAEVIRPTADTIAAGAKAGVSTLAELTPWVAAALIAVVLGYLVFAFRR